MPFGLPGSRSSSKSAIVKGSLSDMESGRFKMSGIFHDGHKNKSSNKFKKSTHSSGEKHYQKYQNEIKHNQKQQQYQQIQPRSGTSSGRLPQSQRSRSNNKYPPHQYQQVIQHQYQREHEMQLQQFSSMPDNLLIEHSHSNQSQGSRHSSQSKLSSSSASGQKRQQNQHQNQHRRTGSNNSNSGHSRASSNTNSRFQQQQQHKRVPSANSELGSIHSLPTATSRSTISDPSSHSRGGGYQSSHSIVNNDSRRIPSNHQYSSTTEHRDPHGETTNSRRTQHYSNFNSPPRHHQSVLPQQALHPHGLTTSFPASPIVEPTTNKSSGASVNSYHSRGSISYHSGVPNVGKSSVASATSVVSKDKQAIKSTKKVIEELKKSIDMSYSADKQVIALTNACAEFDHLDDSRHNMELQQGAAEILCKILAIILNNAEVEVYGSSGVANNGVKHGIIFKGAGTKDTTATPNVAMSEENEINDDALRMVATALEMVFRGQSVYVHSAYVKCGSNADHEDAVSGYSPTGGLLPLLLRLLNRAEGLQHGYRMKQHNYEISLINTTKVLLYLSRVPELRIHLARQPVLLNALSRLTSKGMGMTGVVDSNISLPVTEARMIKIRIIANLVNQEENKPLLLAHRFSQGNEQNSSIGDKENGLLDALLRVAHMDPNDQSREYAGVALMDLASAPSNQISMTNNEQLLGTLVKMILLEKNAGIRESAITALQNLAFTKENRIRLVSFKHGVILEALVRALSNTGKDFNEKSRRRSAGALTNLACDESARLMGQHKGLLQTLAIVSTKDESPEVQTRAAMALTKLAASITMRMESSKNNESKPLEQADALVDNVGVYSTLLDALVVASLSPVSNSVSAVLRVKARDPENRYLMARHPGILDTLVDMCLYENKDRMARSRNNFNVSTGNCSKTSYKIDIIKDRDNATRALMHLTNESRNRTVMCTPTVLKALVRGASLIDEEIKKEEQRKQLHDVRDSAIRAIERLATEFSNRHKMAHHDGLIVAIARATEREAKLERGNADISVLLKDQAALSNSTDANISVNESVDLSSHNSTLTPRPSRNQNPLQESQHARLAKPLLMSLLVAM
mmetsp:Transcript_5409/g.13592  ORF Transcript_5409/g.13592 Transcript_5409/m.13592 type:complete len:1089 (+) Transcript_5409:135-3401(+)